MTDTTDAMSDDDMTETTDEMSDDEMSDDMSDDEIGVAEGDLLVVAAGRDDLTILVATVEAAGLTGALSDDGRRRSSLRTTKRSWTTSARWA